MALVKRLDQDEDEDLCLLRYAHKNKVVEAIPVVKSDPLAAILCKLDLIGKENQSESFEWLKILLNELENHSKNKTYGWAL